MQVNRTFHPIGQGAFYTEAIQFASGDRFTVVYDCGSSTFRPKDIFPKSKSRLFEIIQNELPHEKRDEDGRIEVDILVLSHFDGDHINGCSCLAPKLIVIPFLTETQLLYLDVISENFNRAAYANIHTLFPNSKILQIEANDSEDILRGSWQFENRNPERINGRDISEENIANGNWIGRFSSDNLMRSGEGITLQEGSPESIAWEYIFFNPNWEALATEFLDRLTKDGLDKRKLATDKAYFLDMLESLKTIYSNLRGNRKTSLKGMKNEHSLQLYSGATVPMTVKDNLPFLFYCYPYRRKLWRYRLPSGCLYCGDITVEDEWRDKYFASLGPNRLRNVGTIQISHHGSVESNGDGILNHPAFQIRPITCIISVGTNNSYHHPSPHTLNRILSMGHPLHLVTENPETGYMQEFR